MPEKCLLATNMVAEPATVLGPGQLPTNAPLASGPMPPPIVYTDALDFLRSLGQKIDREPSDLEGSGMTHDAIVSVLREMQAMRVEPVDRGNATAEAAIPTAAQARAHWQQREQPAAADQETRTRHVKLEDSSSDGGAMDQPTQYELDAMYELPQVTKVTKDEGGTRTPPPRPDTTRDAITALTEMVRQNLHAMAAMMKRFEAKPPGDGSEGSDSGSSEGAAAAAEEAAKVGKEEGNQSGTRKQRLMDRKGFVNVLEFSGGADKVDTWVWKLRGFLEEDEVFRPILDWLLKVAIQEKDEHGRRPTTLLGPKGCVGVGPDAWLPGHGAAHVDSIPSELGRLMVPDAKGMPVHIKSWAAEELQWAGEQ